MTLIADMKPFQCRIRGCEAIATHALHFDDGQEDWYVCPACFVSLSEAVAEVEVAAMIDRMKEAAKMIEEFERKVTVVLPCNGDMIPEENVEFVGIEENVYGEDVLEYKCPVCDEVHKSLRLG